MTTTIDCSFSSIIILITFWLVKTLNILLESHANDEGIAKKFLGKTKNIL